VRDLHARLGPTKLLWGSDMPNVERSCTYRQSLDYLRRHCAFIPAADLDLIVGGNADRLYFRSGVS
jgi:predicted TIM-barrel fold metal-dependent hydrolase